jgi:tRNA(adenine34) deaminase
MTFNDIEFFMNLALEQAEKAYQQGEVPVGAVIVDSSGKEIAKASNLKELENNPCGHAEILAIQEAAKAISNWRLSGCSLFVTLEPCPMCLAAMVQARIDHCFFGAYDSKGGALSLNYNLNDDQRLNHSFKVTGGIFHYRCSKMLSQFFKERRSGYFRPQN